MSRVVQPNPLLPALRGAFADRADALTASGTAWSWERLAAVVDATARRLGDRPVVAVEATPTLDTIVAVLSCLAAGVAAVPVPPDAGPVEREHILRDSGAVPMPDLAWDATAPDPLPEPPESSTGLIIYTSGTTGPPKGVVLSRGALAAAVDGLATAWQWGPHDTLVHGLPLFHVHGLVLGVLGALRNGSALVHTGRPTAESYAATSGHGTLYFGVPTVWGRVCDVESAAQSLSGARLLVSGSAPLPVPVFERLQSLTGHAPVERYGMTETLITLSTRADGERRPGWVGLPVGATLTRLVGDDGEVVAHDGETIGELHVAGPSMFDGYLGRAETTKASFDGEWFRTGDAAVIDRDGFHRIVGRQSMDIIKTGGFKVGAGEVETALMGHPSVREVAVVGVPDDDLGERIVAVVVADGTVDPSTLQQHVADTLSVHKRPREVRLVDELPRNAMGKVQKHLLR
ncbi:MAG: acyl-CoA synthetase [Ilumatobacteraceae bacterium]